MEVAILVAVFKVKALWRFAQADAKHGRWWKHPLPSAGAVVRCCLVPWSFAQDAGKLAQLFLVMSCPSPGWRRRLHLSGMAAFGTRPYLVDKVAQHIPLTAVVERSRNQMGRSICRCLAHPAFPECFPGSSWIFPVYRRTGCSSGKELKVFQIQFVASPGNAGS